MAQVIQAELKAVGVEVIFETLESAAWTQRWRSGQWEAVVSAWFLPADPGITGLYACKGANNMTGFCDPELDQLLERSDQALSFDARKPLLDQAQATPRGAGAHAAPVPQRHPRGGAEARAALPGQRHQLRQLLEPLRVDARGRASHGRLHRAAGCCRWCRSCSASPSSSSR